MVLRPLARVDIPDYERWNDPDRKAFLYDGPQFTRGDLSALVAGRKRCLENGQSVPYRFLELDTKEGRHIGWVNSYGFDNNPHDVKIGISILEDTFWSKGFGTEAVPLWVEYLFREFNLTRIGFSTWQGNERMLKLGRKLGFTEESRIRRSCFVRGQFYDGISMGMLREEWQAKQRPA